MSTEHGTRSGMVAPDAATFDYVRGRPFAPRGVLWDRAVAEWTTLPTDAGARFDRDGALAAADIAPMVTWGTSPQDAAPITGRVPDPSQVDRARPESLGRAAVYMRLPAWL